MPTLKHVRESSYRSLQLAACLALGAACSGEAAPAPADSDAAQVCAACVPVDPGEDSSATSGCTAACSLAYLKRSIDQAEAEMLGFPVTAGVALIERSIDAPMIWVPKESEGGGPATGYERTTRIRGEFKVQSYEYGWLDPTRCDGTRCKLDDQSTTEQSLCPDRYLMMQVSGALETLDGAIQAHFPTQRVNVRMPGQANDLVVSAAADLSEVRGSLQLDPSVPVPHVGRLDLSLQFADSEHRGFGVLSVSVTPDWDNLPEGAGPRVAGPLAYYSPLEGQWGEPPSDAPIVSGQ
jgi:hypothetical protein